ncbi:MAG: hypothetical protein JW828_09315, partial [Sedimentisphaerales bacterium]|nr:hypothetical protein [Sedimentisphaerales bacterium]
MDVKLNPQGYLIYATMATYLFGFIPAMLCKALQFKEHLKKMGLRAILAGTGLSLFGTLFILMVAIRHRFNYGFFPYKDLRIALLALGSLFAVFFLIGLIAIILWFLFVTSSRNQTGKLTQVLGMISRMFLIASVILVWVTYIYRWIHVKHLPMQNLFEVFLTLGVLIVPLSVFCKRYFRIDALASDLLLGFVILFPAGFFFHSEPQKL